MLLGMMQPYFFPYLGYFDLINRTDRWIFFDSAQYIRHGWVNRNRILHPTTGWQYIIVPLQKYSQFAAIKAIQTRPQAEWRAKILGQLMHYRRRAPFFRPTITLVEECLATDDTSLANLNVHGVDLVCRYLGIERKLEIFSEMGLTLGPIEGPDDWALRAAQAIGADAYVNPPGGATFYDPARYEAAGVRLTFQKPFDFSYDCPGFQFEPSLSVIDAMMWNAPERIKARLDQAKSSSS